MKRFKEIAAILLFALLAVGFHVVGYGIVGQWWWPVGF
ncbi:Uncharacterised protein [Salmonella enterica subsp. enterica serovar Typhi]|nr:Uncharacterised protein [Salmonella enterica subsp. enterica serovar Typhi]CHF26177.1 Uncharacterised protein [Salmonella enterica subsp. enterica serovar Typhi]CHF48625.1 Uncharacterised protein [Salmonella enterica subsp. enterica serovar Typhi]CHM23987.1 Uncharacterised protein [Salmonella enterica subsp. enterica serovar Typhi]